jgi:hypothetical protein
VARQLRALSFDAYALAGGYRAWKQAFDVEPLSSTPRLRPRRKEAGPLLPLYYAAWPDW